MPAPDTSNSPPAKPVIRSYPTPDLRDRIYVENRDARTTGYELPEKGSKYEGRDATKYEGWVFATAVPSDKVGWTDHYYLNERANQDAYNFAIEYPWVDKEYPRYTRTYLFLRTDLVEPCPHEPDPADDRLVLVSWKLDRLTDPVQDSLFIGVTKVYERVPAPTKVVLDRPESILPYNQRVAVPAIVETQVQEDATDGDAPTITNQDDWHVEEATDTAFRKTVERTKRVIPDGGSVLLSTELTREQQVARVTSTWARGIQSVGNPKAEVIESVVTNVGNNTSVKETKVVPRVYPNAEFDTSIPDTVPPEFRDMLPIRSTAITSSGIPSPPDLGPGELERKSEAITELTHRETVVGRDLDQLPKTLVDQLIDGIQTHGAEFGGVFDNERTLARGNQDVQEGFGIIRSSVKHLGSGLTARETERLSTLAGASLLLLDGGSGYFCDPAVVFDAGTIGGGAAGTAVLSAVPGGTGDPGQDPGGTFTLNYASNGDANGAFYFIGARYNNGTWRNPAEAENIAITYNGDQQYPVSQDVLNSTVDREAGMRMILVPLEGGGHFLAYDLGAGRRIAANKITLRSNSGNQSGFHKHIRVQGFNDPSEVRTTLANVAMPATADTWVATTITDPTPYRYFFLFGTDGPVDPNTNPPIFPRFAITEIELYGTLTITPSSALNYVFDGDPNGVFYYLGKRGGGGTWRNPQTNGDVDLSADGGLVAGTLDQIVDRQPSNVYTDGNPARAFNFDLKEGRKLFCNKISFRQRTQFGSGTQSFNLQARNDVLDPLAWVDLATIFPSQTPDTWTSTDITSGASYREFRIISGQGNFTIGEFELYGELQLEEPPVITTYSVTAVNMTLGGADYISAPEVRFTGGGGTGAAGTAVLTNGAVTSVTITNSGAGYTSAPDVTFHVRGGGSGATATSGVTGGGVTSTTIVTPGSEYTDPPIVTFVGVGTGATGHAILTGGGVSAIVIDTIGSGYSVAPAVLFTTAGGPVGDADVGYGVQSISVVNPGTGYNAPPAVRIIGDGHNGTATARIGYNVSTVVMNNRGSGYTSNPTPQFAGSGSGASGSAVRGFAVASVAYSPNATLYTTPPDVEISGQGTYGTGAQFVTVLGRPILSAVVGVHGAGYTSNPAVAITGDGSGATGHSVRSFAVASATVTDPGSGYSVPPFIQISPPTGANGIQATAHATLLAGAIDTIVIDNPGYGYLTAPTIVISGAAATAVLEAGGVVDSIVIDTAGQDFTTPAAVNISGGGGTGASATSTLNNSAQGHLRRVDLVAGGSGYEAAPVLSVAGGTAPVATLSTSGQIVAVTITTSGSGYTGPIAVSFAGGGGSGAAGTAYLNTNGGIIAIDVTNPGTCYTEIPDIEIVGGGGTGADAVATLYPTGSVCRLTLIEPGPEYTVPPIVSFFGCWEGGVEGWTLTGSLTAPGRARHTATLLLNGKVLVAGGLSDGSGVLDSCQLYDPATELWTSTGSMGHVRYDHAATLLPNGKVLVSGGNDGSDLATAEIYDPLFGTWSNTGSFTGARSLHTATLMNNGKVLIAGGIGLGLATARIYDPGLGTWSNAANMAFTHDAHAALLLDNGDVLISSGSGGAGLKNEVYNVAGNSWTTIGNSITAHSNSRLVRLSTGKILAVAGGNPSSHKKCELLDQNTLTWVATGDMIQDRLQHTATLLDSGLVLAAGGFKNGTGNTGTCETYDATSGTWTQVQTMNNKRIQHTATLLPNGKVLVVGGYDDDGISTQTAELYSVGSGDPARAIYVLGTGWPILNDIITDPVEGIVVDVEKKIVRPNTDIIQAVGSFVDIYALDKYRSIQITSRIRLPLPPAETFVQTHNLSLPPLLLSVTAAFSRARSVGIHINEGFGSASVKSTVQGNILVKAQAGYNGAAAATVIRTFMFGPPLPGQTPNPLVITPSTGTAYLTTRRGARAESGGTTGGFSYVELSEESSEVIDAVDIKGVLTGATSFGSNSGVQAVNAQTLASEGIVLAQARGINDTTNISIAVAESNASASAVMSLAIPVSCPAVIPTGTTFLLAAGVEKWRFNVYVQTLIYVTVPECP